MDVAGTVRSLQVQLLMKAVLNLAKGKPIIHVLYPSCFSIPSPSFITLSADFQKDLFISQISEW